MSSERPGLVNTMVFTHIPSSVFLLTVPFAPSFPVAAALFLLREGLVEMDVPTRQSCVMAMVRPEERTVDSGVTHLFRPSPVMRRQGGVESLPAAQSKKAGPCAVTPGRPERR